ncbi:MULTISPECIES: KilA-N domain-containing protein [Chryseobacterium]|uniref:KilA-N domain-containing protein n=1 Tax=Candidatus Chryseobacterium massiliense TaxID=204089 RepID=A0A3D9B5S2_9FLAO|nr:MULTISPECIES: KilA-N domain-containing protein [Chryseobacterium]REC48809.1 KilA-N domain-containing protein [Candidatus Chryseobacterium massiliae]
MKKIQVDDKIIAITSYKDEDYICLTDMVRGEEGNDHIRNWMRNRNTVEFLGIWEQLYNPNFKGVEFDTFKKEAGLNSFNLTPKKWIEATDAIGIVSKSGRQGGTYAHRDIAFEFGAWISPMFKLLLIKEFQRLKEIEANQFNLEWDVKRILSKINYHIHTDAVKNHIIPSSNYAKNSEWLAYAEEADVLNVALFGYTAKQWREANPQQTLEGKNMRDFASINKLTVLSNLESFNSELIKSKLDKQTRFNNLYRIAKQQLEILNQKDFIKSVKKISDNTYLDQ